MSLVWVQVQEWDYFSKDTIVPHKSISCFFEKKILTQRRRDRKGTQSLPHVIRKDKNNMKVNSLRVIINARIMANKKWKNITWGLSENFFQKVFALNVSAASV